MEIAIHPDLLIRLDARRKQILADLILWLRDYSDDAAAAKEVARGIGSKRTSLARHLGARLVEKDVTHEGRPVHTIKSEDMKDNVELIFSANALSIMSSTDYIIPTPPNIKTEASPAPTAPPPPAGLSLLSNDASIEAPEPETERDELPPLAQPTGGAGKKKRLHRDPFIQSIIGIIPDDDERKAIQGSYDRYLTEFPEIAAAPDRACLASLLTAELAIYRLQCKVVKDSNVQFGKEMEAAQKVWQTAAETLRLTRDQRVSDGESDGMTFAQLVEQYDDIQSKAMAELEEVLKEEDAMRHRPAERLNRQADTGAGEVILKEGFGIVIDRTAGRLVPVEKSKEEHDFESEKDAGLIPDEVTDGIPAALAPPPPPPPPPPVLPFLPAELLPEVPTDG